MGSRVRLQVHHVRFYERQPQAINCIAYDDLTQSAAISRSDGSIEIYSVKHNWSHVMTFLGSADASVESLVWSSGRLFAAGLGGNVVELDFKTKKVKHSVSSNAGPIWCMTKNSSGEQLAVGTEDGCITLFDISDDEPHFLRGFGKESSRIISIAWYDLNGENVIITGGINNIRQWSVKSGQPISRLVPGKLFQSADTIVWSLVVTKTYTIISGDSRGIVTFWNGKQSVQIKQFHSHKADVLSLCLNKQENKVFSCGVDANIYQYSVAEGHNQWVFSILHNRHTHDVRAVTVAEGKLVSGGVDALARVADLDKTIYTISPFQSSSLVDLAVSSPLILLQYPTYLEVWRLGDAETCAEKTLGVLPLKRRQTKLVQLKARPDCEMICSALSSTHVLAFSDTKSVRVYQLTLEEEINGGTEISVNNLKYKLSGPASLLQFSPNGEKLVIVLQESNAQVMNVSNGLVMATINAPADCVTQLLSISCDSQLIAIASTNSEIHLYSSNTGQLLCSCPVLALNVSALRFSPHSYNLIIAYSNHSIYEFDVVEKKYTVWSTNNSDKFPHQWLKPCRQIWNIMFHPTDSNHIYFHTDNTLCTLDLSMALSEIKFFQKKKRDKEAVIRRCYKYKHLLRAEFLSDGSLVVVERPPTAIDVSLPPSFKRKKFGIS